MADERIPDEEWIGDMSRAVHRAGELVHELDAQLDHDGEVLLVLMCATRVASERLKAIVGVEEATRAIKACGMFALMNVKIEIELDAEKNSTRTEYVGPKR